MLNFYPRCYVIDSNGNEIAELGTYVMSFQAYSGSDLTTSDSSVFKSQLQTYTENYSMLGGSIVVADGYATNADFFLSVIPVIDAKYMGSITNSSYKLKFVFSDNGDYLIGVNTLSSSAAGLIFTAYNANDEMIYNNIQIPAALNQLNDPTYTYNSPQFLMLRPSNISNTEFIVSGTVRDYYISVSSDGDYFSISHRTSNDGLYRFLNRHEPNVPPTPEPNDPYSGGGTSTTGGGGGDFDGSSDPVDFPALPSLSAVDTGFITLFNPSASQLRDLANYMWSNPLFDLDAWKKIFANPMDAILGLSIVPVDVPSGSAAPVTVGNISTGVSMTKATAQYVEVDCGSINVNEFWGAYLDYSPYTKCEVHLPYCGIHPLDVDEIMGKTIAVKYHVDILSGACTAYVKCGDSVLYEFVGQCAASIPITGDNWTNVINGVMQIAASVGTMVATGGLSAPVTGANAAESIGKAVAIDANIGSTIMSMKPAIEKSGSLGGVGGMLAIQKPYLILSRPNQALPENQNHFTGYPSFITAALTDLTGYTEIEQIHLEGVPATSAELDEIVTLLKGGVTL